MIFRRKPKQICIEICRIDGRFKTSETYKLYLEQRGDQVLVAVGPSEGIGNDVSIACTAKIRK